MGRFNNWADDGDEVPHQAPAAVQVVAPPAEPQELRVHYPPPAPVVGPRGPVHAPAPAPVLVQVAAYGTGPRPIQTIPAIGDSCSIVKGGQPEWDGVMSRFIDLAAQAGRTEGMGIDATRDFVGVPEFAAMSQWTDNARYYNGASDRTARGQVDAHLGTRYQETTSGIRSSKGTPKGTGVQNL